MSRLDICIACGLKDPRWSSICSEPTRTTADRAVLKFAREQTFSPGDFTLNAEGMVRLHPKLARRVVGLADVAGTLILC